LVEQAAAVMEQAVEMLLMEHLIQEAEAEAALAQSKIAHQAHQIVAQQVVLD
jgi:hypothetical protein